MITSVQSTDLFSLKGVTSNVYGAITNLKSVATDLLTTTTYLLYFSVKLEPRYLVSRKRLPHKSGQGFVLSNKS